MADNKLTGNVRIISRAEAFEAERVNEAAEGAFWELMTAKIQGMIVDAQKVLADSDEDRDLARAQGAVRALRRVLELPEIIRKEVKRRNEA